MFKYTLLLMVALTGFVSTAQDKSVKNETDAKVAQLIEGSWVHRGHHVSCETIDSSISRLDSEKSAMDSLTIQYSFSIDGHFERVSSNPVMVRCKSLSSGTYSIADGLVEFKEASDQRVCPDGTSTNGSVKSDSRKIQYIFKDGVEYLLIESHLETRCTPNEDGQDTMFNIYERIVMG